MQSNKIFKKCFMHKCTTFLMCLVDIIDLLYGFKVVGMVAGLM